MNLSHTFFAAIILVVCSTSYGSPPPLADSQQKPNEAAEVSVKEQKVISRPAEVPSSVIVQEDVSSFSPFLEESQPAPPFPNSFMEIPEEDINGDVDGAEERLSEQEIAPVESARTKRHYIGGFYGRPRHFGGYGGGYRRYHGGYGSFRPSYYGYRPHYYHLGK